MQRLAALVPRPRLHLIRFHGVLAPHAKLRAAIVPRPAENAIGHAAHHAPDAPARMSWAHLTQTRLRHRYRTLPALWRRLEDYRRHRRSRCDRQDPRASGLASARAAALPGAAAGSVPSGLILKPRPVQQQHRRAGSARTRANGQIASKSAASGRCRVRRLPATGLTKHSCD